MLTLEKLLTTKKQNDPVQAPWVVLFNPYYSKPIISILIDPFPAQEFCLVSPWENHQCVSWSPTVETIAKASGWPCVPSFMRWRIKQAALSGV